MAKKLNQLINGNPFFLFLVFCVSFAIFRASLTVYFVQDDFWLLDISRASNITGFVNMFLPLPDAVWYRPLSSQVFFYISRKFFGLNPVYYHAVVMLSHFVVTYLLFKTVYKISGSKLIARVSAVIYGLHQIHVIALSWLAAYSFVLGPLFVILTLYYYISRRFLASWLAFLAGLLATEVGIVGILIVGAYDFIVTQNLRSRRLIPYILTVIFVLWLRLFAFPTQTHNDLYSFTLSPGIFETLKFYMFRFAGVPLFFDELPQWQKNSVIAGIIALIVCLAIGFKHLQVYQTERKKFIFFSVFMMFAILPFLLLRQHIAPYYLSFALLGGAVSAGYLTESCVKRLGHSWLILGGLTGVFIYVQIIGIKSTYLTHWLFSREQLARKLINEERLVHPVGTEEYFALGANSAAKVFPTKLQISD